MDTQQKIDIAKANIDNLTSLWTTAGSPFGTYTSRHGFDLVTVPESDWPNRLWFKEKPDENIIKEALEVIRSAPQKLTVPYWDISGEGEWEQPGSYGFAEVFEQVGMSLPLSTLFPEPERLDIRPVTDRYEAKTWASLYPGAFGYLIGENILLQTGDAVKYFLVYFQNRPIGTAIMYYTGKVAGIHGVGVIPEMRRNGFAEEIMRFTLNEAIRSGAEYATLQASAMGKGLYDKLGFTEQFRMKNYVLE